VRDAVTHVVCESQTLANFEEIHGKISWKKKLRWKF
jgi:hypothetical protein